ncbi:MAG: hypothetical protein J5507_05180 [Clostridia bacterium]|nr:hypothetical protein [Clostridia bacterium]
MFRELKKVLIEKCDDFIALQNDADRCFKESEDNLNEQITLSNEKKSYIIKRFHQKRITEIDDTISKLDKRSKELDKKSKEIDDKIKEINQTIRIWSISSAEDYKSKVEQAKSLRDLDLDFKKAIEILSKSNIEVVLDESDKMPNNVMAMSGIGGKEGYAIAFTHLTDYLPENGEILRMIDKGARHKISGEWGEVEIDPTRGTTHLAACSEVANVYGSSWDNKKIGIILPLNGLEKDINITSYSPADFQIRSKVRIPNNGYIICPKDMVDEAKQKNPNLNIIGYEGENVRGLVNQMLVYLGYDYSRVGEDGFISEIQTSIYKEKIEEYFGIKEPNFVRHVNTKERQDERIGYFFKKLDAFIKGIECKTVNYNDDYKQKIISIIMQGIDTDKISELILEQLGVINENQTIKKIVENKLDKTRDSIRENTTINDLVKDSLGDSITTTELDNIDKINEVKIDGTSPEVQESK